MANTYCSVEEQALLDVRRMYDESVKKEEEYNKKLGKVDWNILKKKKEERDTEPFEFNLRNYTVVSAGVFNMVRESDSLKNPSSLLWYLLQWKGYADKKGIGGRYYEKGFVVASQSIEQMALDLNVSERTVKRWISALEKDGLIKVSKHGIYNIYVLGIVGENKGKKIEHYFYTGEVKV